MSPFRHHDLPEGPCVVHRRLTGHQHHHRATHGAAATRSPCPVGDIGVLVVAAPPTTARRTAGSSNHLHRLPSAMREAGASRRRKPPPRTRYTRDHVQPLLPRSVALLVLVVAVAVGATNLRIQDGIRTRWKRSGRTVRPSVSRWTFPDSPDGRTLDPISQSQYRLGISVLLGRPPRLALRPAYHQASFFKVMAMALWSAEAAPVSRWPSGDCELAGRGRPAKHRRLRIVG